MANRGILVNVHEATFCPIWTLLCKDMMAYDVLAFTATMRIVKVEYKRLYANSEEEDVRHICVKIYCPDRIIHYWRVSLFAWRIFLNDIKFTSEECSLAWQKEGF